MNPCFAVKCLFLKIFYCNVVHREGNILVNLEQYAFYQNPGGRFSILKIFADINTVCAFRLQHRFGNLKWSIRLLWLI